MINHRELLKKYIKHVIDNEGVAFLPGPTDVEFDAGEVAELMNVLREIESGK